MTRRAKIISGSAAAAVVVALLVLLYLAADLALGMLVAPGARADYDVRHADIGSDYPEAEAWLDSLRGCDALRDTFITAGGGRRLHALYARSAVATPKTAILVHGWHNSSIGMLSYGYIYNGLLGWNILLPDLNAHGLSDGTSIGMGWNDRLDLMRWIGVADSLFAPADSLTGRRTAGTEILLHGVSMGAATVMCTGGEQLPPCVKAIIEDCGYTSVRDEVESYSDELSRDATGLIKAVAGLKSVVIPAASLLCRLRYGWSFGEASPLRQVAKCRLPMMFIHGTDDDFVPTWMVRPLYDAKPEPKVLWLAPGSKHARSYQDHQAEYINRVRGFTDTYVR